MSNPIFYDAMTQRNEFCRRSGLDGDVFLGMHTPLYLPTVNRVSGGTPDALDSFATVSLPEGFWISFFDNNEITQSGFLNFRLTIGAVPDGAESPQVVIPLDNATSGAYWKKG